MARAHTGGICAVLLCCGIPAFSQAVTQSFNGRIYSVKDTFVVQDYSVVQFGTDGEMTVFWNSKLSAIKFDLPPQIAGATVVRADLTLYSRSPYDGGTCQLVARRAVGDWDEDEVTFDTLGVDATEVGRSTRYAMDTLFFQAVTIDVRSAISCVANGTCSNDGFVLSTPDGEYTVLTTREFPDADQRPYLDLEIVDGTPAPEFTSSPGPELPLFAPNPSPDTLMSNELIWYRDIEGRNDIIHPESDRIIGWMASDPSHTFSPGGRIEMTADFHPLVIEADEAVPLREFGLHPDFYVGSADYGPIPVPPGGAVEAHDDYNCLNEESGRDCHLTIIDKSRARLFDYWIFDIPNGQWDGPGGTHHTGSVWDLSQDYGWNTVQGMSEMQLMGRGMGCTSADAAGFPITPLLVTPEEIQAGQINHAIRFVLNNRNIRHMKFTAPATHPTGGSYGPRDALPYGAQLRLKPDAHLMAEYGLTLNGNGELAGVVDIIGGTPGVDTVPITPGARAIIRAMQKYGMFLADGGDYALTIASDRLSDVKYCENPPCYEDPNRLLGAFDLAFLKITDFEIIDNGPTYFGDDCKLLNDDHWQNRVLLENRPQKVTSQTSVNIGVGGYDVASYSYRLDDGGYSVPTSLSQPIVLSGLAVGKHKLFVIGQNSSGEWQPERFAARCLWEVAPNPTGLELSFSGNASSVEGNAGTAGLSLTVTLTPETP